MKIFGNVPDRPFGWPEGTVRAILALMVIFGSFIAFIFTTKLSEGTFVALITGVLGYFFGSQSVKKTETVAPPTIIAAADPSQVSIITPTPATSVPTPAVAVTVSPAPVPEAETEEEIKG